MPMSMRLAAVLAVVLAAPAAGAEPQPSVPVAPPIIRVMAPPAPPAPPMPPDWLKASGVVDGKPFALLINGDRAALVERLGDRGPGGQRFFTIDSFNGVLALLADRRFEFLWPQLELWAGLDLGLFRERLRQQAEEISLRAGRPFPSSSAESATSPILSSYIRLTAIYMQIGETPRAEQVLQTYLAAIGPKGRSSQQTMDWVLAKARLATVMQFDGRVEQSLRQYEDIQAQAGKSEFGLNGMINHAATLVESRRYAEALDLIDRAWALFTKSGDEALKGSERQFAWIRSCALGGLGRNDEADAAYAVVRNSGDVSDRDYIVDRKESIEWRGLWCRRREADLKALMLAELAASRPSIAVLALQPGYRPEFEDPELLAKLRADPDIVAAARLRMRTLPAAMTPALRKYR